MGPVCLSPLRHVNFDVWKTRTRVRSSWVRVSCYLFSDTKQLVLEQRLSHYSLVLGVMVYLRRRVICTERLVEFSRATQRRMLCMAASSAPRMDELPCGMKMVLVCPCAPTSFSMSLYCVTGHPRQHQHRLWCWHLRGCVHQTLFDSPRGSLRLATWRVSAPIASQFISILGVAVFSAVTANGLVERRVRGCRRRTCVSIIISITSCGVVPGISELNDTTESLSPLMMAWRCRAIPTPARYCERNGRSR